MLIITIFLSILFSCFSTAVMSYISMATPIGPWIAPTLALFGLLFFKLIPTQNVSQSLALAVASGSVGGILATAVGFSFPTIYFLDQTLFNSWMQQPFYFAALLSGLCFCAGAFGLVIANLLEEQLLIKDKLAFPIGQLTYKMIIASKQIKKAYELMIGFASTAFFCMLQDGFLCVQGVVPRACTLMSATNLFFFKIPRIQFDIWPMLWAIGFVTGHVIALPLAVGALTKIFLVDPMNHHYFNSLSSVEFVLAFASGMVLYGAVMSFVGLPGMLRSGLKVFNSSSSKRFNFLNAFKEGCVYAWCRAGKDISLIVSLIMIFSFLTYFQFPFLSQLFLLTGTFGCTYQIAILAGKIGLAPLGRFATFVMVPAMLLFKIDYAQIVFIATFVEICGGVAADILFGRKMGQLAGIERKLVCLYQWLGLIISSLSVGGIFWLLAHHFTIGSPELFAYKAQSRQLLISARNFDFFVMIVGALFSLLLKRAKINPMLVLGGLLMPINISLGLIFGGFMTFLVKDREEWEPFWSGVFAANSIWMLLKAIY